MSTCPAGHPSPDGEYCETCGIRMSSMSSVSTTSATTVMGAVSSGSGEDCPECGDRLVDRFCEGCGFDTLHQQPRMSQPPVSAAPPPSAPPPSAPSGPSAQPGAGLTPSGWAESTGGRWTGGGVDWLAVVGADHGYYERLMAETGSDPTTLPYPAHHPERQYPLTAQFLRIGRRSVGRGIRPDIDLSLPPEDPAVSHEHALLLSKPDGTWSLVDLGATNGTLLNDNPEPVSAHIEVPLRDGDRIYLGAWTVITLRKG